ncbi:MAG: hypothetical protein ACREIB_09815, partial [Pseudomonadota bacterium]
MENEPTAVAFGTGGRGREYPALSDDAHRAILGVFDGTSAFFGGTMGYRATEVRRGYARLEVEN